MEIYNDMIYGIPYAKDKNRGNMSGPREWTEAVIKATKNARKARKECKVKVIFKLPPDKYPPDFPYGGDLDNLLKRFFDALNETVFSEVPGKDSCIKILKASKYKEENELKYGAKLKIVEID